MSCYMFLVVISSLSMRICLTC